MNSQSITSEDAFKDEVCGNNTSNNRMDRFMSIVNDRHIDDYV